jgi:DNA ligase-1
MIWPTLYKRSVTGKVSTWYVEVKDECFRTVSGFLDGQKVTSEWTCCEGKNIGKKNETNPAEQADAEAQAMFDKRKALGYWEDINDIDTLVYFKPMLAHDYNDYKDKILYPLLSDPKLDGVRCIIRSDGMWSRNGKPIISAPHIFESLKPLFEENGDMILDGELFAEKDVADFNTIISCVRKTKPTAADLELSKTFIKYYIYDFPSEDNIFLNRKSVLYNLSLPECCVVVETTKCNSQEELNNKYKEYLVKGYEGQMIRTNSSYENKRSKYLLKRKQFIDDEFTIIGYVEGIGNLSGKIGTLIFNTKEGIEFNAAVNGTHEYLTELWNIKDSLIGRKATVKYFEKTVDGSLRFPKVVNIDRDSYE